MKPAVLVTGGAGYVGSHAAKALAAAGCLPVVYDDLCRGNRWAVRWGPLVEASLLDRDALAGAMAAHGVVAVLHFAALAYAPESIERPDAYFRSNVAGTLNLLEAMVETGVRDLALSSTCAVYGAPAGQPIAETAPIRPITPYGASKAMAEEMARWQAAAYGLRVCALRYFNAAGADNAGEIGEWRDPEPHLIPRAVEAALGLRPSLVVNGTDYPTADGTAVRDYVHVDDLAAAHVAALKRLGDGAETLPPALNLGAGLGRSVHEIVDAVAAAAAARPIVEAGPRRDGDPPILVADATLARRTLGWRAEGSGLDRIVATAVAWRRKLAAEGVPA